MATLAKYTRYKCHLFPQQLLHSLSKLHTSTTTTQLLISAEFCRFNNLYFDLSSQREDIFEEQLDFSIHKWQQDGIRALWAYAPSIKSHFIPTLVERGFDFHYAGSGFVLMSKWMAQNNETCSLPDTPSAIVGVAGVVHNERDEVLLVQEKHTFVERKWKFPGGLANAQENINDAIVREIYEETGIQSTFKSILGFRQQHGVKFGGATANCLISDFYIICRLTVNNNEAKQNINKCEREIYDAQWIPIKEFINNIDSWPINKEFAALVDRNLDAYKEKRGDWSINDVQLSCDITMKELSSVAVPGSMYKLFYCDS